MSSTAQDLLSAGSDGADAVWIRMMTWWSPEYMTQSQTPQSTLQLLINPRLPPLLSPLPNIFRLIAFLIVAPIVFICLVDFAGYAVFRTLGFNRRRVRVKAKQSTQKSSSAKSHRGKATTSGYSAAPVLTPGSYDADTLLRHRERSASAASAEAIEEWTRTGGQFARVSNVQAKRKSGTAAANLLSPSESPQDTFGRVQGVGVEGALLGYFDTDAEDSGLESGQSSPEIGRRGSGSRRGLSGSALGFTPVSNEAGKGLRLEVPLPAVTTTTSSNDVDRSPRSNDSVTSSWIKLEESSNEEGSSASEAAARAAAAADLEPDAAT